MRGFAARVRVAGGGLSKAMWWSPRDGGGATRSQVVVEGAARTVVVVVCEGLGRDVLALIPSLKRKLYIISSQNVHFIYITRKEEKMKEKENTDRDNLSK